MLQCLMLLLARRPKPADAARSPLRLLIAGSLDDRATAVHVAWAAAIGVERGHERWPRAGRTYGALATQEPCEATRTIDVPQQHGLREQES